MRVIYVNDEPKQIKLIHIWEQMNHAFASNYLK